MAAAKHGTRSKYVSGCRCAKCAKANRDYQRGWMKSRYVAGDGWGSHAHGYARNDGSVRLANPWPPRRA